MTALFMRAYPFEKSALPPMRRGTWRPVDKWVAPDDRPAARASGALNAAEAVASPQVPDALRNRVVAARLFGGSMAGAVADEVGEMIDDGRLSPDVGAAILRGLRASAPGTAQGGDGEGGDAPVDVSPFGQPRPINPDYAPAPPADANGFLYPPQLKAQRGHGLMKRGSRSMAELKRIAQLIEESPPGRAPNMAAIEAQVAREKRLGLLRA
jgi:hypothetical protein